MPSIATAAWVIYLVLAFGYRSYAQLRATGRTGFVGFGAAKSGIEKLAATLFVVALVLGFGAAVGGLLSPDGMLTRPLLESTATQLAVGAALYVAGLLATLAAQFAMGTSWRIGVDASERTELVTTGLFGYVRNPIFTAMIIVGVGIVVLYATIPALVAYACLLLALQLQVRAVEEPYLLAVHGDSYRRYAARTGRFFPGLGRLRLPPTHRDLTAVARP